MKTQRKLQAVTSSNKMPPMDANYLAAHRILTEDWMHPELACPGARRSAQMDSIARIIEECSGAIRSAEAMEVRS